MYLFLGTLCFFILSLIAINTVFDVSAVFSDKMKQYNVKKHDNYFMLAFFLSFTKPFVKVLRKIKSKYFIVYIDKIEVMLKTLDYPYTNLNGYAFFILQIIAMLISSLIVFFLLGFDIIIIICAGLLFFMLPYIKIYEQNRKKTAMIIKQLPNTADLLSVMIVSGVDFNNALIKISSILQGTLSKEIKIIISKVSFGIDVKYALNEMAEKYNLEQLNLFVRAVNSSLESGLGISDALNKISEQIKIENASVAEKKAHEAPVKMLIPMTLLILPTIFILLFAPVIISFVKTGSLF
jgi:tight adherence protein C